MAKSCLKTSLSSLLGKLIFVQYNNTRPIELHKTVVSDVNPRVDRDLDLQVISLNKKQPNKLSMWRHDVPGCRHQILIKFESDIQTFMSVYEHSIDI